METLDVWRDFLRDEAARLIGGIMVTRDEPSGEIFRGSITKIRIKNGALVIATERTDHLRRGKNPDNDAEWEDSVMTTFTHVGFRLHEPQKERDGQIRFRSDFRNNILFPKGHRKAPKLRRS